MYQQSRSASFQPVQSQYQGVQNKFQPTGNVQSFYQSANQTGSSSFHTAGYRGNQPGHDSYLRSDSTQPSSSMSMSASSFHTAGYRGDQPGHDSYLRSDSTQPSSSMSTSTSSFHTSGYRGNQPGHDSYLRSDSTQPSSSMSSIGQSSFGPSSYGQSSAVSSGFQSYQAPSPQSFHTANYQGNIQGHDNDLRADSTQPTNSSFSGTSSYR